MNKGKGIFILILVLAATILSLFFVYPIFPFEKFSNNFRPWKLGLDLVGGSHLIYEVDMTNVEDADKDLVMAGLRDVIEKRVNIFGVSEPQVFSAKEGEKHRLVVDLAGITEVSEAIKQIGLTPLLDFREVDATDPENPVFKTTGLTGRFIEGAQLSYDQTTGEPLVLLNFNDEGGKMFEEITGKNVGKPLAVFLDDPNFTNDSRKLISAPTVLQKITGGEAQVTGMNLSEAKSLVERFNAGALPAPIKLVNQQTVSASLGVDSLKKALAAGVVGTLAIMVFMILYYGTLGIFSSAALIIYTILAMAIFKAVPVTMTLSGIAGFILSIGMAVDANVLIFERTKEEIKRGLNKKAAIEEGFKRAWTSIKDSNITTIITSLILYNFTSSFVKGFALTLLIGVLLSMFSAITVTRTMLNVFMREKLNSFSEKQNKNV